MKKLPLILLIFLCLIPIAYAEDCGLLNLASCIPEKLHSFFLNILNAPLIPLLNLTNSLMTEPVNFSLFSSLWAIMLYIISLFYGILMLYAGFNFMISGYDPVKRSVIA